MVQRAPRNRAIGSEAKNNQAAIRELYDRWSKAFRAHDIEGIMAVYAPGDAVVGYDIVGPLQYVGKDAYRKDYEVFLAQYVGPIVSSTATCASFRAVMFFPYETPPRNSSSSITTRSSELRFRPQFVPCKSNRYGRRSCPGQNGVAERWVGSCHIELLH